MSQAWQNYRSAPAPGTRVVRQEDVPTDSAIGVTVQSEKGAFPLLLVRLEDEWRAYVNACPHQYLPLDQRGKRILSEDGELLRCTNHDASFSARTGQGVGGFGEGCALDPVPVSLDREGWLVIAGPV
ncbi:Rieske (2Fe-2S) protein [Billgrantia sp. LNSP4103-1]|uniref:Rieske (2Fe-2S) protein n=1 Tax=Billgrantia sp. LNSP4103-1 TaxID=3410266 RepID=UPI00403F9EC4